MPGEENPVGITEKIEGIPLFLIPKIIADQLRKKGDAVFRIIVMRKFHHRYTVLIETVDEETVQAQLPGAQKEDGDANG